MSIKRWPSLFRSVFIIFFLSTLFSCGSDTGNESSSTAEHKSILVVGDSISTGYDLAAPWPDRLADILNIPVNNSYSVNGVPASYGLTYLQDALSSLEPSHLIIFLGTNDALRGSVKDAIDDLQEMITLANYQNVTVIIATLPVITTSKSQNAKALEISDAIKGFSDVTVADVRHALADGAGVLVDGIHPNDKGQQIIAEKIASVYPQ